MAEGKGGGRGAGRDAQLGVDVLQVPPDRLLAEREGQRDLAIGLAGCYQPQHFRFLGV